MYLKKLRASAVERCREEGHGIGQICEAAEISRSAYYKRQSRGTEKKALESEVVKPISELREEQPPMGGRKLLYECKAEGLGIGRDNLFATLRRHCLLIKPKKSFTKTTYSRHESAVAPNLLKETAVGKAKQVLVGDCTYLRVQGGTFMYLFLLTDLYSRKIVGYHVSRDLTHHAALMALGMARETLGATDGVIHHTDRGVQYCCHEFIKALRQLGMKPSMTDENHCYQNAVAERVNGVLKDEFNLDQVFPTTYAVQGVVRSAIRIYNSKRRHYSLELETPDSVFFQQAA